MRKRAWKRIISTLLIVCMLAGVGPGRQTQAQENGRSAGDADAAGGSI